MTNNTQFKTLVNTWLNQKKPMIAPSTHASFTLIAENHLIPYFGKRKIGSITEADIQSCISYLHDAGKLDNTGGLTVKTIRDVILVLRLSMEFAYKERAIPLLNWDLIEYPKELGIKKVVSLSKDQEQALIQCIYMNLNRKTAGILIALFTGVRIGELCGLQMKDISLTDKTISINKTVQRIYDKKKGESYLHIGPPKTKTSVRTIPVPSLLMNIIKKFYTDNPNHYFLTGKTKPTESRTYRQFFTRFRKRNGLEKVKFHEIRHTFATMSLEGGMDIKTLSAIIGHVSSATTLDIYSHITTEMQEAAARKIDEGYGREQSVQGGRKTVVSEDRIDRDWKPVDGKIRKSGTGCISQINDHIFEGRYTPTNAHGKRESHNVYAKTRADCEILLAAMIEDVRAKIAAEKERLQSGSKK